MWECTQCGEKSRNKMTYCPGCGEYNTLVMVVDKKKLQTKNDNSSIRAKNTDRQPQKLSDGVFVTTERDDTRIPEFNRVLGGGLAKGSSVLIGGEPGIGKSTLLIQVAYEMSKSMNVLYVSAEENENQIKERANRIGLGGDTTLWVVYEPVFEHILTYVRNYDIDLIIIDSINTIYTKELENPAGSPVQIAKIEQTIRDIAKSTGKSFITVSQVNKDGEVRGTNTLQHGCDVVLYLQNDMDGYYRILRAVKNRFGDTRQVGVFEMTANGMISVNNPSQAFLSDRNTVVSGATIVANMEGDRTFLSEVQALLDGANTSNALRQVSGFSRDRLRMLASVINSKLPKLNIKDFDVYVNAVGGVSINDVASDLPVLMSIVSARINTPIPAGVVTIGEVGLTGEIRYTQFLQSRIDEIHRMGFRTVITNARDNITIPKGLNVVIVKDVREAVLSVFGKKESFE